MLPHDESTDAILNVIIEEEKCLGKRIFIEL